MKIRKGFVSNSSSSSFVCSVCGALETGYDGEYGIDIIQCQSCHEYCSSHAPKWTVEDKQHILLADKEFMSDLGGVKTKFVESGREEIINDLFDEYVNNFDYEVPETMCPVCSLSSLSNYNVLQYLLKQTGQTLNDVGAEIRSKFDTLSELLEGLKS